MANAVTLYAAIIAVWTFFLGTLAAIGNADAAAAVLLVTAVAATAVSALANLDG